MTITFNKSGYDPFIDFLKAYSIICVIIAHILPPKFYKYILFQVWGDMQVPMFVLIQVFHAYKKGMKPKLNWNSLLKRLCLPFIAVQVVIVGFKSINGEGVFWTNFIYSGGFGPGSYYIWIYIQLAFLLIIIWPLLKRIAFKYLLIDFIIISIFFEVLFSIIDLPDWLYRLLCIRYLFLIPLGLVWIEKGVLLNRKTILSSVLSIIVVMFFIFSNYDLEPFFFKTGWKTHRWICYFYLPVLLTYGLYLVWDKVKQLQLIEKAVRWTAARSYEIFLSQMAVFVCFPFADFSLILNGIIGISIMVLLVFSLSIFFGGMIYWSRKNVLRW